MKYGVDYEWAQEIFDKRLKDCEKRGKPPRTGGDAELMQIWDTNENNLHEAERLNMLLPVMKWEIENDKLTDWLKEEIYLYYEDIYLGNFDDVIDESEKEKVVHDLTECFNKVFPEGLEK